MTETQQTTLSAEQVERWIQETLLPARRGERAAGNLVLLSADVDRIKEYVFESSRLPEIRGGSITLDRLNRDWPSKGETNLRTLFDRMGLPIGNPEDDDAPSCIIYAAGGSLLALVPEQLGGMNVAKELWKEIEALYPGKTDMATITCVCSVLKDPDALHRDFRRLMDAQTMLLRRHKDQRADMPFVETLPHQRRCESCGARPAARFRTGPPERWLCASCEKKAQSGGRKYWTEKFENWLQPGSPKTISDPYWGDRQAGEDVAPARDLDEIAACGDGHTIGFIYADGDGMGQFIESSQSLREYAQRSRALTQLLPGRVYSALAHHLRVHRIEREDQTRVPIHPFEIITIGGDDLLLIVPGTVALPIALEIGAGFAEDIQRELGAPLTVSAGVVIADHHNPIRFVHNLAEQLLKNAKKRARESKEVDGQGDGAVDFVVLKSQSMLGSDLAGLRARIYQATVPSGDQIWLTARPYLWRDLRQLLDHARLLRETTYPRSQLQALRRVLREGQRWGRMWPSLWYMRQQMRTSRTRRAVMQRIDRDWQAGAASKENIPPWSYITRKKGILRYVTIWEDLYEVFELLPKLDREPEDVQEQVRRLAREVLRRSEQEEAYEN